MTSTTRANYAVSSAQNGNFEHARSVVIDLIQEDWHNAEAHRAWGRVLLEEGKATDAVASFRVAASIDARNPELHFELAEALLTEARKFSFIPLPNRVEANEAIATGLSLAPDHPRGLELRAMWHSSDEIVF